VVFHGITSFTINRTLKVLLILYHLDEEFGQGDTERLGEVALKLATVIHRSSSIRAEIGIFRAMETIITSGRGVN